MEVVRKTFKSELINGSQAIVNLYGPDIIIFCGGQTIVFNYNKHSLPEMELSLELDHMSSYNAVRIVDWIFLQFTGIKR